MKEIRPRRRFQLLGIYSALMLYLALIPSPPEPSNFLAWDKLQHALAFSLHTFLALWFIISFPLPRMRALSYGLITSILFGAMVEVLQGTMTVGRRAEWSDLTADAIGAATGLVVFIFLSSWVQSAKVGRE